MSQYDRICCLCISVRTAKKPARAHLAVSKCVTACGVLQLTRPPV